MLRGRAHPAFAKVTVAYFDCYSGISGDMTLGALIDAGADAKLLDAAVNALGLSAEVDVAVSREQRGHVGGTRVLVSIRDGKHRNAGALLTTVGGADLPEDVKARALKALNLLAAVEGHLHGTEP